MKLDEIDNYAVFLQNRLRTLLTTYEMDFVSLPGTTQISIMMPGDDHVVVPIKFKNVVVDYITIRDGETFESVQDHVVRILISFNERTMQGYIPLGPTTSLNTIPNNVIPMKKRTVRKIRL